MNESTRFAEVLEYVGLFCICCVQLCYDFGDYLREGRVEQTTYCTSNRTFEKELHKSHFQILMNQKTAGQPEEWYIRRSKCAPNELLMLTMV